MRVTVNIDESLRANLDRRAAEKKMSRSGTLEAVLAESFGVEPPEHFLTSDSPAAKNDAPGRKPKATEPPLFEEPEDTGAL